MINKIDYKSNNTMAETAATKTTEATTATTAATTNEATTAISATIRNSTNDNNNTNYSNNFIAFLPCRQRPEFVSSLNDSNCDGLQLLEGVVDREQRLGRHQVLDVLVDGLEVHPRPQFELARPSINFINNFY